MFYLENIRDLDAYVDEMSRLKPWQRPENYRSDMSPDWQSKYPLHALVEFANGDFEIDLDFDDEAIAAFKLGHTLADMDDEGYTVLDYVSANKEAGNKLRELQALAEPAVQESIRESEELEASALPANAPSRKRRLGTKVSHIGGSQNG